MRAYLPGRPEHVGRVHVEPRDDPRNEIADEEQLGGGDGRVVKVEREVVADLAHSEHDVGDLGFAAGCLGGG